VSSELRGSREPVPPEDVSGCLHFRLDGGHALGRRWLLLSTE
jgi:hypothetical protein